MVEETECAWLDREHRCLARRRFLAASLGSMVMETILMHLNLEGPLASTRHPLIYVSFAGMILLTLLGSWIALWIVNRLR
jgi:hypothetical protein